MPWICDNCSSANEDERTVCFVCERARNTRRRYIGVGRDDSSVIRSGDIGGDKKTFLSLIRSKTKKIKLDHILNKLDQTKTILFFSFLFLLIIQFIILVVSGRLGQIGAFFTEAFERASWRVKYLWLLIDYSWSTEIYPHLEKCIQFIADYWVMMWTRILDNAFALWRILLGVGKTVERKFM